MKREIKLDCEAGRLGATLAVPASPRGIVLFAHGSGSSRFSARNQFVAGVLEQAGLATLLVDLLTEGEADDRRKVFDCDLLAMRLILFAHWAARNPESSRLPVGYFGASTGAAAALIAAAREPSAVRAVISRGGRPDLAEGFLESVQAPTLLIVGGDDQACIPLNKAALRQLRCDKELVIIPGATHLFPEPGALEKVASLARDWLLQHLPTAQAQGAT
jgi:putative phosphoribosyl transferase